MTTTFALTDVRLSLPPRRKVRGGEWDWFSALTFGQQQSVRRHMVKDGMGPDELARWVGLEIDEACERWMVANRLESTTGKRECDEWSERSDEEIQAMIDDETLVSVPEVAERLGVTVHAVRNWRQRGVVPPFPEPRGVVSHGIPVWTWGQIREWADERSSK